MIATVLPNDVTDNTVTWSISSVDGFATFDPITGTLSADTVGTFIVRATANDGSGIYDEKTVTIVPVPSILVTDIVISSNGGSTVIVGGSLQMIATVLPGDATDGSVTWHSSDPDVATIDDTGLLTAKAIGTVIVRATANDGSTISDSMTITITSVPVDPSTTPSDDPKDMLLYAIVIICLVAVVIAGIFIFIRKNE